MNFILPGHSLAAAASADAAGTSIIDFETALLLVIVVCLVFMARALADLRRRVEELTAKKSATSASVPRPTATPAAPSSLHGVPSAETLAVITAAVYATFDHPVQIVAVDEVTTEQARHWSLEGRRQIFTSHRVR